MSIKEGKGNGLISVRALSCSVFFFQAEDGIRDGRVTGVQTCALPIFELEMVVGELLIDRYGEFQVEKELPDYHFELNQTARKFDYCSRAFGPVKELSAARSEERRVGKECSSRWAPAPSRRKEITKRPW